MNHVPKSRSVGLVLAIAAAFLVSAAPLSAATLFGLLNTGELYQSTDVGVTWSCPFS